MAQLNLTRAGVFDPTKLGVLEGKLRTQWPGAQVYGTDTGLLALWPNGLTAPQQTAAQAVINAHVEPTDVSLLTPLQQQAMNYLAIANPTTAQTNAAVKGVIKYLLSISFGQQPSKAKIDGTDITT